MKTPAPPTGAAARGLAAVALAIVVAVAATLRFHGLDWGLPDLFEEATPFFRAWDMASWGTERPLHPDPGFFRYPSLTFYVHLAAHALLVAGTWLRGGIEAVRDVPVDFLADRTRFLLASRTVSALFGVGAVIGVFAAARRAGGTAAAVIAGAALAVNAAHVERSQFIDVDGPMACFVAWGLWACLRVADRGTMRDHVVAGVLTGLAASAKYPGALLVVPLAVAALWRWGEGGVPRARWREVTVRLAAAFAAAAFAFAATSPFVVVHLPTALGEVAVERQHMERGHFGQDAGPAWKYYLQQLAGPVLGIPMLVAAGVGLVLGLRRRRSWAVVFAALAVVVAVLLGAWRMQADRYVWPLALPLLLLAAAGLAEGTRAIASRDVRVGALVVGGLVLALPAAVSLPSMYALRRDDPRSLARAWIERQVPPGSFLVMEAWGPDLLEPVDLWALSSSQRDRFLARAPRPLYAVLNLPTYQVMPDGSEAFYDRRLYPDADYFVLSSNVGDRYRREPERFAMQLTFYETLAARGAPVAEFGRQDDLGGRPRITVYRAADATRPPFGARRDVEGPQDLDAARRRPRAGESSFFADEALNYETFGFLPQALAAYARAAAAGEWASGKLSDIGAGVARCLRAQGRGAEAVKAVEALAARATFPADVDRLRELAQRLKADAGGRPAGGDAGAAPRAGG